MLYLDAGLLCMCATPSSYSILKAGAVLICEYEKEKNDYCIWTSYLKRLNVIPSFMCALEFSPIKKLISVKIWEIKGKEMWFTGRL